MPNFALLNNVDHENLRVIRDYSSQYGDNEVSVVTFPQEFRAIQNEYPIFFKKNAETGKFIPVALMGLRQNENVFLSEAGWDAQYIPASVKRRPFLIGVQPPKLAVGGWYVQSQTLCIQCRKCSKVCSALGLFRLGHRHDLRGSGEHCPKAAGCWR